MYAGLGAPHPMAESTWKKRNKKITYALNKNINLQLRNLPVGILIKVIQKSIPPSNHTFVIVLIGHVSAPMSVPN